MSLAKAIACLLCTVIISGTAVALYFLLRSSEKPDFTQVNFLNPHSVDCFMNASLQVLLRLPEARSLPEDLAGLNRDTPVARQISALVPKFINPTANRLDAMALRETFVNLDHTRQHDADDFIQTFLNHIDSTTLEISTIFKQVTHRYRILGGLRVDEEEAPATPLRRPEGAGLIDRDRDTRSTFILPFPEVIATPEEVLALPALIAAQLGRRLVPEDASLITEQTIRDAPDVLIVMIGRFRAVDGGTLRVANPVRIPLEDLAFGDKRYNLHGIINHVGADASGGHYTATVRAADGTWYNYDDLSGVTKVALRQHMVSSEAYVAVFRVAQ